MTTASPPTATGTNTVFIEPDDGRAPLVDRLDAAKKTISRGIYILREEEIVQALERAYDRGVEVRIVTNENNLGGDDDPTNAFDRLAADGIAVQWDDLAFVFTHIKTFVIDGSMAIIMTLNLVKTLFLDNREYAVVTTDPAAVDQVKKIFEADWPAGDETPDGPLVVSPTNSRLELLEPIASADRQLCQQLLRGPPGGGGSGAPRYPRPRQPPPRPLCCPHLTYCLQVSGCQAP
jgi:cardiolipin synthase